MTNPAQMPVTPAQFLASCRTHYRLWLAPTIALGLVAGLYATFRTPSWQAVQGLIVRNEAATGQGEPGKFAGPEEMKTIQETILQLATSRRVLAAALNEVGPPPDQRNKTNWPTLRDVEAFRRAVKIKPPAGTEFGTTEVFYVTVRQPDRHRAMALATAIADQLQARFQELRNAKARSMIDELTNAVQLARQDLARSTARLAEIENQVGSDLAELRMLNESMSGESALRRMVVEVENQARQLRLSQKTNRQLLDLLRQCRSAPDRLVATPNRLLASQPALRQLKEGLVAAQLSTSELLGRYTEEHPLVQAAREGERQIKANLHRELDHAVEGVEIDLQLDAERLAMLDQRRAELEAKLRRLARLRAAYANQLAETRNRTQLLEQAEQKLAEARMSQATAKAASLIGRLDDPETGANPVGPSRLAILLVGVTGGLISGFGLVFLRHPYAKPATMAPGPEGNGQPGTAAPPAVPGTVKKAFVELESLPEWN